MTSSKKVPTNSWLTCVSSAISAPDLSVPVQRTACASRPHGKTLGGFGGAPFWVDQTPDAHRAYRETEGDAIRRQSGSIANYRCDHDRYTQNSRINASPEAGDSE